MGPLGAVLGASATHNQFHNRTQRAARTTEWESKPRRSREGVTPTEDRIGQDGCPADRETHLGLLRTPCEVERLEAVFKELDPLQQERR